MSQCDGTADDDGMLRQQGQPAGNGVGARQLEGIRILVVGTADREATANPSGGEGTASNSFALLKARVKGPRRSSAGGNHCRENVGLERFSGENGAIGAAQIADENPAVLERDLAVTLGDEAHARPGQRDFRGWQPADDDRLRTERIGFLLPNTPIGNPHEILSTGFFLGRVHRRCCNGLVRNGTQPPAVVRWR